MKMVANKGKPRDDKCKECWNAGLDETDPLNYQKFVHINGPLPTNEAIRIVSERSATRF